MGLPSGFRFRAPLAGLLAAWVFLLGAAQVSPALHSWMHETCDHGCGEHEPVSSPEHHCAVVFFSANEPDPFLVPEPVWCPRSVATSLSPVEPERLRATARIWPRAPPRG